MTRPSPAEVVHGRHVREMAAALDRYSSQVSLIENRAVISNAQWENREIGLSEADERLREIQVMLSALHTNIRDREFGYSVVAQNQELLDVMESMEEAAGDMIDGLHAADTGEARRVALAALLTATNRLYALRDELAAMAEP